MNESPADEELTVIEPDTQVGIRNAGTSTRALTKAEYDRLMANRDRPLTQEPMQRRRGITATNIPTTDSKDFL